MSRQNPIAKLIRLKSKVEKASDDKPMTRRKLS